MDTRIKEMFDACNAFIESATLDELIAYEKSLAIDYDKYSDGIDFSGFVELNFSIQIEETSTYKCESPIPFESKKLEYTFVDAA